MRHKKNPGFLMIITLKKKLCIKGSLSPNNKQICRHNCIRYVSIDICSLLGALTQAIKKRLFKIRAIEKDVNISVVFLSRTKSLIFEITLLLLAKDEKYVYYYLSNKQPQNHSIDRIWRKNSLKSFEIQEDKRL